MNHSASFRKVVAVPDRQTSRVSRRRLLGGIGSIAAVAVTGCTSTSLANEYDSGKYEIVSQDSSGAILGFESYGDAKEKLHVTLKKPGVGDETYRKMVVEEGDVKPWIKMVGDTSQRLSIPLKPWLNTPRETFKLTLITNNNTVVGTGKVTVRWPDLKGREDKYD